MRYQTFAEKEYYHVFNRGSDRKKIFIDDADYARFVFLITHLQSPIKIYNISWYTKDFLKKGRFNSKEKTISNIIKQRSVELISFALMPNHFHLLVKNNEEQVLSVYMQRILTAYSKYFNAKYQKKGHVFEGPFGAVHVSNNTQLLHTSAYIHKNPKELPDWNQNYEKYPWSSYQDYIGLNRWGDLINPGIVLEQFNNQAKYKEFVNESTAKEF